MNYKASKHISLLLVFCASLASSFTAGAAEGAAVKPAELDQAMREVIERREFQWRLPREKVQPDETGLLAKFFTAVLTTAKRWLKPVVRWIKQVMEWLIENLAPRAEPGAPQGSWTTLRLFLYALLALAAVALARLLWSLWRQRYPQQLAVARAVMAAAANLQDESTSADQLPEDGWLNLARELLQQGNFRLAMRALYLASLAHLARRELLVIAKFKSNREYERELARRARAQPELVEAFGRNVALFERIWYGRHEVSSEIVRDFSANLARIQA